MPGFHANSHFTDNRGNLDFVGRYGDNVRFADFPNTLNQDPALQAHFGFTPVKVSFKLSPSESLVKSGSKTIKP